MSLTVQQLLSDAKRLTARLRDHDDAANKVVSHAQEAFKSVTEMRTYQEDIEALNAIAHNRPRAQLVLGMFSEHRGHLGIKMVDIIENQGTKCDV